MFQHIVRILTLLIILSEDVYSVLRPWNTEFSLQYSICKSQECSRHARFLAEIVNPRMKPCVDFYDYVCSDWQRDHSPSSYYFEWSIVSQVAETALMRTRNLLEKDPIKGDSKEMQRAKFVFKKCMDLPFLGIVNAASVAAYVNESKYFPIIFNSKDAGFEKQTWMEIHNYYLSITGESAFFTMYPIIKKDPAYTIYIHISRGKSAYGLIKSKKILTVEQVKLYQDFLVALINIVYPPDKHKVSQADINKAVLDVMVFRTVLHMIFLFKPSNDFDTGNVDSLTKWQAQYTKWNKITRQISWLTIIQNLYKNLRPPAVIGRKKVKIENLKYFRSLPRMLKDVSEDTIVNHLHLYFMERHLDLNDNLRDMILRVIIRNGKLRGFMRYIRKRWHICVLSNPMKEEIGKAYVSKYFQESVQTDVSYLMKDIKDMLKLTIQDSTWMSKLLMKESINLVDDVKFSIGYPEYYDREQHKSSKNMREDTLQPGQIAAMYSPETHRISISAAYFEPPIYDSALPYVFRYSTVGMIAAHEMYHLFGPYDGHNDTLLQLIQSKNTILTYEQKKQCFLEQFHHIPVRELEHLIPAPVIDGYRTLDENIADTMGLKLAYEAYRKRMWELKKCPLLPNQYGMNCEKYFFISFASMFCSKSRIDKILEDVESEDHMPPRLRVNGAVSNMQEFSNAFNCPKDSPMNPPKKCYLW